MTFGQRLKELRTEKRMTQDDLGEIMNVSKASISLYEKNERTPDQATLIKTADFFDVSLDYLLGRSDKRHYYSLTEKDNRDVDQKIKDIMDGLDPDGPDFFKNDGNLSDHDKELLLVSLRQSYALARELAKKKYTPKKYRGSETDD